MRDIHELGVRSPLASMAITITYSHNLGLQSRYNCIYRTRIAHARSTA